jgi:hypothetical protein
VRRHFFYGGSTGNPTVTGHRTGRHGRLALTDDVGITTPPSAMSQGVIDLAVTQDKKFQYVQNGTSSTVDGLHIDRNGYLTKVTTARARAPTAAWTSPAAPKPTNSSTLEHRVSTESLTAPQHVPTLHGSVPMLV